MELQNLFNPGSIAVIGASNNKNKLGWQVLNNLKTGGFKGKIFPINPSSKKINNLTAYPNIGSVKSRIDLAIIIIPAQVVNQVVKECAQNKIKNLIIISAGFSEAGSEGQVREKELKRLAKDYQLNILGPNCLGLVNPDKKINATFSDFKTNSQAKNKMAFISQSGAIGSALFDWIQAENIGLKYFISLGNKAVLDENHFFKYFKEDKQVEMVVAYLEEIARGEEFMEQVSKLAKLKPVIILKSGQTEAGSQATLSHTGSLAGSREAIETGLKRSGAMVVNNLEEFFNLIKFWQVVLEKKLSIKTEGIEDLAIVSNAGGPLVITVDELSKLNLKLPKFSPKTIKALKKALPHITSYQNPLDILGDASADFYEKALQTLIQSEKINTFLVLLTPQTATEVEKTAQVINKIALKNKNKLILTSFIGGKSLGKARQILNQGQVINFDYPSQAIFVLAKLATYQKTVKDLKIYKNNSSKTLFEISKIRQTRQRDFLTSFKLLNKYKIPTVQSSIIETDKDLAKLDYPIVLKMTGETIIHKTDKQAIVTGLKTKAEAYQAFQKLKKSFPNKSDYCLAQPMIQAGQEIILGFKRDQAFGPIILIGQGGIYAEVFQDIQTETADVCKERAKKAIKNLKIFPILKGVRGKSGYDLDQLAEAMVSLGRLARENPNICELDINPLFVLTKGCLAVDVRIIEAF